MQIYGYEYYGNRHAICFGDGATSFFFKIDPENPDTGNDWFNWQADAAAGNPVEIDLDALLPKNINMTDNIYGYVGTQT